MGLDISQLTQTMSPGLNRLLVFLCKILEQKLPTLAIRKIRLLFSPAEGDVGDCGGGEVVKVAPNALKGMGRGEKYRSLQRLTC